MITHRPSESSSDVISYAAGTKFKPASEVQVSVGAKQFSLFTQSDTAWSRDAVTDHAIASAIRHGASMTVIGVSAQGVKIADTVQLKGASAAYAAIGKACGLVVDEPKPKQAAQKTVKKAK